MIQTTHLCDSLTPVALSHSETQLASEYLLALTGDASVAGTYCVPA